jgi:hypothetical protein
LPGAGSNAQSTAFAVQGLLAAGVDPNSLHRRGASPIDYLRSLIAADGHVRYSREADQSPVWVTAEALMALDAKALPLAPVARPSSAPVHQATPPVTAPSQASPTTAPARRSTRARPARVPRPSAQPVPPPSGPGVDLDRLAGYAGILTALTLATVGAS